MLRQFTWSIPSRLTLTDLVWKLNQCFDTAALNIQWIPETDGYYIHADYVFSLSGNLGTIIPASGSQSHTWRIPFNDGAYYVNYGPMVGEYPVDITNGLSNIRAVLQHREEQDDTTACECADGQLVQELLLQEPHVGAMF